MKNAPKPGSFWATNGQNLALSSSKWHKKNLIGENGGERKINPSANPVRQATYIKLLSKFSSVKLWKISYPSVLTYVLGTQKNCLNETVLLSTKHILDNKFFNFTLLQ